MRSLGLFIACLWLFSSSPAQARILNGFDLSQSSIPEAAIQSGGPPRDGIPALTNPKFVMASQAGFLADQDQVIGVEMGRHAKAYPIRVLNWHEIVNDRLGNKEIVVTYCPLCGTGMVFDANIRGKHFTFGVSGLLYQSDVLLYDHQSKSLWSQLMMQAVNGSQRGQRLKLLPAIQTTWAKWQQQHPQTLVLSTETGHSRNYARDPYSSYETSRALYFDVSHLDSQQHPKTWTFAIRRAQSIKLYPWPTVLKRQIKSDKKQAFTIKDTLDQQSYQIRIDPRSRTVMVTNPQGIQEPIITGYWFALRAFYPQADVYKP